MSCCAIQRCGTVVVLAAGTALPSCPPRGCRNAQVAHYIIQRALLLRRFQCLLTNDSSQRSVHRFRVGEYLGDIRLQNDDVRSFCITARVFSTLALREIVFVAHRSSCGFIRCFLHRTPAGGSSADNADIIASVRMNDNEQFTAKRSAHCDVTAFGQRMLEHMDFSLLKKPN